MNTRGASVAVVDLCKKFGQVTAVDHVSIEVAGGEFLALLGPSGSGKSTVLMSLAGFEMPTSGKVLIGGRDCTRLPPHKRNIGMVFQHYTLFPHMSVLDNVAFPLKMRGVSVAERHRSAERALNIVRLGGYGSRMPKELSGGQQQRVALARAIVYQPQLLLMDEPLSALDKNLREEMQLEIKRLHNELGITIVFVTHDQGEALTMADRIAVLEGGKVQQISTARELYERPATLFTAGFIGEMNFIEAQWDGQAARFFNDQVLALDKTALMGGVTPGPAVLTVRPDRVQITRRGTAGSIPGIVSDIVYAGAGTLVIVKLANESTLRVRVQSVDIPGLMPGDPIGVVIPENAVLLYPGAR
ncbi:MAG: ABC transporter ATP-binding protein [Aestuariivirga sp.]